MPQLPCVELGVRLHGDGFSPEHLNTLTSHQNNTPILEKVLWGFTKMRDQLFTLRKDPTNAWLLDNGSKDSPWVQHLLPYINTEKGLFWAQTGIFTIKTDYIAAGLVAIVFLLLFSPRTKFACLLSWYLYLFRAGRKIEARGNDNK